MTSRTVRRVTIVLLALLAVLAGGLFLAVRTAPIAVAYLCPQCFGFEDLGDGVFVERGIAPPDRDRLLQEIAGARSRVARFYGTVIGRNDFLVCATEACNDGMGGVRARGLTVADVLVYLAPSGRNATIIAHELSHIELHGRLGDGGAGSVPAWFDEGLAVLVSEDERYIDPTRSGAAACRVEDDGRPLPVGITDWSDVADVGDHAVYAWAGCRVSRWLAGHDGIAGLTGRIQAIREGRTDLDWN